MQYLSVFKLLSVFAAWIAFTSTPSAHARARRLDPAILEPISHDYKTPAEAASALQELSERLQRRGDKRSLFPSVYHVTVATTAAKLARREFKRPEWVHNLVVNYANLYRQTIYRELTGQRRKTPLGWQLNFDYIATANNWSPDTDIVYGIQVHIARDLVEALYVTPTDFNDPGTRADFFLITDILRDAMPTIWSTFLAYGHSMMMPACLEQTVMMNWIARMRSDAWENAGRTYHYSKKQRKRFLHELDAWLANLVQTFGILVALQ